MTSEDPSQPPHRGGITKCIRKCAPPLFGAKQEDPAWEDTALGCVYPALDLQRSLPTQKTLGFSVHGLTSRTAGTQPDLMSGKSRQCCYPTTWIKLFSLLARPENHHTTSPSCGSPDLTLTHFSGLIALICTRNKDPFQGVEHLKR